MIDEAAIRPPVWADHQIAAGLQAGKGEAWSALYEGHFDRVWRLAARMIGPDTAAVADVVQETFLAAARSARTFDPSRGGLWEWLSGIARNHVGTYFRLRRREGRVKEGGDLHAALAGQWAARVRSDAAAPEAAQVSAEEAQLVRAALAGLSDEYRAVLAARYCEEVSVEEIARLSACTETAVRSRLARARRAFREAFEELEKLGTDPTFRGSGAGPCP
jgi:RNA polymerase sigma-70 factor (ECF subfamily)